MSLSGLGGGTEASKGVETYFLLHACVQGSCWETEDSDRFSNTFDHPDEVSEDEAGARVGGVVKGGCVSGLYMYY